MRGLPLPNAPEEAPQGLRRRVGGLGPLTPVPSTALFGAEVNSKERSRSQSLVRLGTERPRKYTGLRNKRTVSSNACSPAMQSAAKRPILRLLENGPFNQIRLVPNIPFGSSTRSTRGVLGMFGVDFSPTADTAVRSPVDLAQAYFFSRALLKQNRFSPNGVDQVSGVFEGSFRQGADLP